MRFVRRGLVWVGLAMVVVGMVSGHTDAPVHADVPGYADVPGHADAAGHADVPETAGVDFPRLGMWFPRVAAETLDAVARYDWVVLQTHDAWAIPALRARNPGIVLLDTTNACEVRYDPGSTGGGRVHRIPPEWFLTQVGSTLTAAVDATQTVLPVAAVSARDGVRTFDLFVPGDTVLIEGESVRVEAVDAEQRLLTVRRGYVRPVSAHAAGTRVAAHITFWPNTWMLNLSTLSPLAVADAAVGPELWADYNARAAVAVANGAAWDGIVIDRADIDQSWIIGHSTARTIDPDQSNTLLTDYGAFDAAWNAGVRRMQAAVRAELGDEKVIVSNWGMPNYDLLNGNNFEAFPRGGEPGYAETWHGAVFGPSPDGAYTEWVARAREPQLSMIQTYEDDSGVDPWGQEAYDNPCDDPGFVPNYRKMRFGLATALLADGYFSYEMHTTGHGALCLMWFDEYEGGLGYPWRGRGYLGQPLGPARRAVPALATPNLLGDGAFEDGLGDWWLTVHTAAGYRASAGVDGTAAAEGAQSARVEVTESAGTPWRVALSMAPVEVVSGTEMTLAFWARADRARTMGMTVQVNGDPWDVHVWLDGVTLTPEWQAFELTRVAVGSDPAAVFRFLLGGETGTVWLDDVRLQVGSREVWRRDYTRGVALANATAVTQTVVVGEGLRRIHGLQAPEVNDGQPATEVALAPFDGIVLLRDVELSERMYVPLVTRE